MFAVTADGVRKKDPVFVSTFHELCFFYDKWSRHFVTGTQVFSELRKLEWSSIRLEESKNKNSDLSIEKSAEHVSVVESCQRSQLVNRYCGGLKVIYLLLCAVYLTGTYFVPARHHFGKLNM